MPLNKLNIKKKIKKSNINATSRITFNKRRGGGYWYRDGDCNTVTAGKTAATRLHRHDGAGGRKCKFKME